MYYLRVALHYGAKTCYVDTFALGYEEFLFVAHGAFFRVWIFQYFGFLPPALKLGNITLPYHM